MPDKLGIKVDDIPITDNCAKILALAIRGLSHKQIEKITLIRTRIISNELSVHYKLFDTERCVHALTYFALDYGLNYNYSFYDKQVLDEAEKQRLRQHFPKLLKEIQLVITFPPPRRKKKK